MFKRITYKFIITLYIITLISLLGCEIEQGQNKGDITESQYYVSFRPDPGVLYNAAEVSLFSQHGSGAIYYTTDGSTPTTESQLYTDPISIDRDVTFKAIVTAEGYENSEIFEAEYTFQCDKPTISATNTLSGSLTSIELLCNTEDVAIYYTIDESEPTSNSTLYTNSIFIDSTTTIKAIAIREGFSNSEILTKSYTVESNLFNYSYNLNSVTVIQTSEAGDKQTEKTPGSFVSNSVIPEGNIIIIDPEVTKQTIDGFGSSLTESSAYVLSYLSDSDRTEVLNAFFGETGSNYTMSRTHIGSCDFSVEGKYSYAETEDDFQDHFTVYEDERGFSQTPAPDYYAEGISPTNVNYDLIPMIQEVLEIKPDLKIIASPWTAPPWMKDNNNWFGGALKAEHYSTFAEYFEKYLTAYQNRDIDIWAITPENEPLGNGGQWESMLFSDSSMANFIGMHLGPTLETNFSDVKILSFDQNRDHVLDWGRTILGDSNAAPYIYGSAVHWYRSSYLTFNETLDTLHEEFPDKIILNSEACIDSIGDDEEVYSWWLNDEWWWNPNATEWGHLYASESDKVMHPPYTPVHRYARNIIEGLNHWLTAWVDWNMVLDKRGGPNHVDNFCGAPIMIDPETSEIYYTPVYDTLSHFSKYIRPGDVVCNTILHTPELASGDLYSTSVINDQGVITVELLNTTDSEIEYNLLVGDQISTLTIAANAIQTLILN